jgi:uncharacterized heparinase superfamily protein
LLETIEIATNLSNEKNFAELNTLNEISSDLGSSLRYLQFGNGNLISAHGGCLGDYNKYVKLLAAMKPIKDIDRVNKLGFRRFDGGRLSMIVDASPPLYGKKHEISHAGFSSFELYHGKEAIFINCGGGSRFGLEYRKYCQSSKAHNILLLNEKSQCSFGKKNVLRSIPQYYIKDGPRKTPINYEKTITEKIIELSHDAYQKDYGVSVHRKLSMDLLKNRLIGQETVIIEEEPKKNMTDSIVSVYFHLHPSIVYKKRSKEVVLETPGKRKMLFTHNGGKLSFEKSTYIGNFFEPQDTSKIIIESNIGENGFKINWQIEEIVG